ncbi:MAG: hypothetical protein ACKVON_17015 [Beijerinckiaceae bacterium]
MNLSRAQRRNTSVPQWMRSVATGSSERSNVP